MSEEARPQNAGASEHKSADSAEPSECVRAEHNNLSEHVRVGHA